MWCRTSRQADRPCQGHSTFAGCSHPSVDWKTFVANRVAEVQRRTSDAHWHHLPGKDNPADCASRGLSPVALVTHSLWWKGPPWLSLSNEPWPTPTAITHDGNPPERKTVHVTAMESMMEESDMLTQFSSLHRLIKVTAWCRR